MATVKGGLQAVIVVWAVLLALWLLLLSTTYVSFFSVEQRLEAPPFDASAAAVLRFGKRTVVVTTSPHSSPPSLTFSGDDLGNPRVSNRSSINPFTPPRDDSDNPSSSDRSSVDPLTSPRDDSDNSSFSNRSSINPLTPPANALDNARVSDGGPVDSLTSHGDVSDASRVSDGGSVDPLTQSGNASDIARASNGGSVNALTSFGDGSDNARFSNRSSIDPLNSPGDALDNTKVSDRISIDPLALPRNASENARVSDKTSVDPLTSAGYALENARVSDRDYIYPLTRPRDASDNAKVSDGGSVNPLTLPRDASDNARVSGRVSVDALTSPRDTSDNRKVSDRISIDPLTLPGDVSDNARVYGNGANSIAPGFSERFTVVGPDAITIQTGSVNNSCATAEEMSSVAVADTRSASSHVRKLIQNFLSKHGAVNVRALSAEEFCARSFIYGRAAEDGFGNDMFKLLTAAGISVMLNRSLIIGEHGSVNPLYLGLSGRVRFPFGNYLEFSNQTFSMSELKHLWVKNGCFDKYHRPLYIRVDDFQKPSQTKVFCEDWSSWKDPIIWFKGTTDSTGLQFFLKNRHHKMRSLASLLMGDPSEASMRGNVFGELFRALIAPKPVIEEAVQWALQGGPDPDVSLHMRMMNKRSRYAVDAACRCVSKALGKLRLPNRIPRVVVVTDTPSIIKTIQEKLDGIAMVVYFDYESFLSSLKNSSEVMSATTFKPPEKRTRDWGSMPRWVALVDFFLASRATHAVVSGAHRRVATTYAQLLAALAAANQDNEGDSEGLGFYSSFQSSLLMDGLSQQKGWGHSWRRFGGVLSCKNQTDQCAATPLLSYAWWDMKWQSPLPRDMNKMLAYGIQLSNVGAASIESLGVSCKSRAKTANQVIQLQLPPCKKIKLC